MTTIVTVAGDALDEIVALHYGTEAVSAALADVLLENSGLAQMGNDLPAGTRIRLPEQTAITHQRPALW